jgi:prefoldin subunit 5
MATNCRFTLREIIPIFGENVRLSQYRCREMTAATEGPGMSEDLEEIRERQDQLERYASLLEGRIDMLDTLMEMSSAERKLAALPDRSSAAQDTGRAPIGEEDRRLKGLDNLLRSILTKQGMHNTDIRESTRDQKRLLSSVERVIRRLGSIEEELRHVDRNVKTLVKGNEAG